ncbi:MAG: cupin-like domain-containing protein [Taibaiella sp.]|nr:cupin-like domain-containing protein [Taibaiella sp.]
MEIQKVGDISYEDFMEQYYKPGIPVVFKDAAKVWKAKGLFSPAWFRANYGDKVTEHDGKKYTMRQVMDLVEASTESKPAPYPFLFSIPDIIPEVWPMVQPLNLNYAKPNWLENKWFQRGYWGSATEIFVGGPGGRFPYLHLDFYHLNAWITQLYGEKQFTVFPKDQEHLLYPKPGDAWRSEVNIFEPDYEKHPLYRNATPIQFTVKAGETLFIPAGTWHSAYSLTPTISVAFDQLNSRNYKDFMKDVWVLKKREGFAKAMGMYLYAKLGGQMCKGSR